MGGDGHVTCMHMCSTHPLTPPTFYISRVEDLNDVERLAVTEMGVASRLSSPVVNTTINTKSMAFERFAG